MKPIKKTIKPAKAVKKVAPKKKVAEPVMVKPAESPKTCCTSQPCGSFGRVFWGLLILLFGLLYLGRNWGILPDFHINFSNVWPFLLIFVGLSMINRRSRLSILIGVLGAAAFVAVAVFLISFADNRYSYEPASDSLPAITHINEEATTTDEIATTSIRLIDFKANQKIVSPLEIKGEARGSWFFEGSFPIRLVAENGVELGQTIAKADGEWMTNDFVEFEAKLDFKTATTSKGILILERDNPSGLPDKAEQYMVPISF
jgi:hypothetical protein